MRMLDFIAARANEPHPVTFVLGALIICGAVALAVGAAVGAAAFFGGRARGPSPRGPRLSPIGLVGGVAAAYFAFFAAVTVARHRAMATNAFDLGYFANVIYNFGRGHPFRQTLVGVTNGFSDACAPILAVFVPLSFIFAEPTFLLVLQSLFIASGVVLVYALGRPAEGSRWPAAALALSFALSPALHGANLCEFHPRALAVPFALGAFYFFSRKYFWPGVASAALLALCREDLALHAVALAAYGGFAAGRKRAGLVAAALLALYYLGVCSFLYPRLTYAGGGAPYFKGFFARGEYLQRQTLMAPFIIPAKLAYIGTLVLAVAAFLPAAGGALATLVTPLAVPALATKGRVFFGIWWHYPLTILPFVYGVAALGVRRLVRPKIPPRRLFWVAGASVAAVVFHLLFIAYFGGRYYLPTLATAFPGSYERGLAAAAARVPAKVPICVDDRFAAHLAFRRYIYLYGSLPPAAPKPTPAAMLLERRLYRPTDLPTILSRAARWNLTAAEISEDYVYFAAGETRFSGEDLFATWFDSIEEWECLRPTKLFTHGGTSVADARAHDGRAFRSSGTLRYRPLKGDVYPPGDYVLTFYLRGEERQRVVVDVTLNAAAGFVAEKTYRGEGEVNPAAYKPLELAVASERPFRFAFDISSVSPFYFDAVTVASDTFTLAALSEIAPPGK